MGFQETLEWLTLPTQDDDQPNFGRVNTWIFREDADFCIQEHPITTIPTIPAPKIPNQNQYSSPVHHEVEE